MKRVIFALLVTVSLLFTGCLNDDDGYSLGDIWIGFGIVEDEQSFRIKLDGDEILIPVAFSDYMSSTPMLKTGDRVFLNYTVLDEKKNNVDSIEAYYVKINDYEKVLMKGILDITDAIEDSIGNDPIIVLDHWVSNNLLNLKLKYWGEQKKHYINLVKEPGVLTAAGQPFELELRHNDNDDNQSIAFVSFVSFKLDSLEINGLDSIRFKVSSKNYNDETITFEKVYKYSENN
jgi:hypothetical protein